MKRAVVMGTVAAVLLSGGLGAQGRNFAGTWTIDAEKTATANPAGAAGGRGGGAGGGGTIVAGGAIGERQIAVVGGGSGGGGRGAVASAGAMRSVGGAAASGMSLTVDASTFTIVNGATTTAYKLDGSITSIDNPMRKTTAKASWQGDRVVIETTAEGPNGPIVTQANWYLEGDSLVRENKSTGQDGQEVVRKTYYKRS